MSKESSLVELTGKHSAGTIRHHQAQAITLSGTESLPRFQGPGLNLPRPKKSFRKIGVVNAVYCAMAPTTLLALDVHMAIPVNTCRC